MRKNKITKMPLKDEANLIKLNQYIGKKTGAVKPLSKRESNVLKNAANAKKVALNKAKYKK